MSGNAEAVRRVSLVRSELGIAVQDSGSPVGLRMDELVEVGLRRNPRRAQLLVSTVLGKHLAADPRVVAGAGRLLGALVARTLDGQTGPVPVSWAQAAHSAVTGKNPAALITLLDKVPVPTTAGVLTFGFAETATSVGHLVADQLGSGYLHSTRRRDGPVPISAEFSEPHSHATGHLVRPDPRGLLEGAGPVVLVDDELSTGRTALNVIQALHAVAPRGRYVLAGLVDVRSEQDDGNRATVEQRLGCRIDVVSLVRGEIILPAGIVDRVAAELGEATAAAPAVRRRWPVEHSRLDLPWPADVPTGGRHGFGPEQRPAFDTAVSRAVRALTTAIGTASRILVLGTEELMYLPLRLALELSRDPLRSVVFQSTTRSPVHAIDRPGYPIRRRIDFLTGVLGSGAGAVAPESGLRHVYNLCWPVAAGPSRTAEAALEEADLIIAVDDGHALPGADGVAQAVSSATGVPVVLAVLTPRPIR